MISSILESTIAQVAYDLERSGKGCKVKDHLALAILSNSGTKAVRSLKTILSQSQLQAIVAHLVRGLNTECYSTSSAAAFLRDYREYLRLKHAGSGIISTTDALIDILEDNTTLLCEAFQLYAITEKEYYESSQYPHSTVFSDVGLG